MELGVFRREFGQKTGKWMEIFDQNLDPKFWF